MKDFLHLLKCGPKQDPVIGPDGEEVSVKASELNAGMPGSYLVHINGEMDLRCAYCALVIMDVLGLKEESLTDGLGDFIASCQTYEGGISNMPFGEAHGGYTYCGLASMILLGETHKLDLERLACWLKNRQCSPEAGFNGRTNKLVDSCYNFWVGACFELLDIALKGKGNVDGYWLCNQEAV